MRAQERSGEYQRIKLLGIMASRPATSGNHLVEGTRILFWYTLLIATSWIFSCSRPPIKNGLPLTVSSSVALPPPAPSGSQALPVDVLTQHDDPQRTGANLRETLLTPESVASGNFHNLFSWPVDGQIYAQPLYVSGVSYKGSAPFDIVVVATMMDKVYAFKAPSPGSDAKPNDSLLWSKSLGNPVPAIRFTTIWQILGPNIFPWIGITSTPVIDRDRGTIYLTVKSWDPDSEEVSYELFGLDLQDGHIKDRSGQIIADKDNTATIKYTASNGVVSPLDPKYLLQRAGLLEANDRIYLGFGTHMDTQPSHGWLLAYNADNLSGPPRVYCTTCGTAFQKCKDEQDLVYRFKDKGDVCMGGIWQGG